MRPAGEAGFKTVELVVTAALFGLIIAVVAPNYVTLWQRGHEAAIKTNMHTLQVALEDFAVQNESFYPTDSTTRLPDGRTLEQTLPSGRFPENPITQAPSVVQFGTDPIPGLPGELAIHPALPISYLIKGNGVRGSVLAFTLKSGQ